MENTEMTLAEFEELAFAHGPDLSDWPLPAQTNAATFLKASPEARDLLQSVADLQAALLSARPEDPAPSVDLMSRILADAATVQPVLAPASAPPPANASFMSRLWDVFSPAAACAASAAVGLWLGYAGPVDLTDVAGGTFELAGLATSGEFSLLDDLSASPIAGVGDFLEGSE